jgi:hypothetical protein
LWGRESTFLTYHRKTCDKLVREVAFQGSGFWGGLDP